MADASPKTNSNLRAIPSVDQLLHTETAEQLRKSLGQPRVLALARDVINELRERIQSDESKDHGKDALLIEATQRLETAGELESLTSLRRVINATGVILHTNLGRAPLSETARQAVADAAGYCTLEYDPVTGSRGKRGGRVEELLIQLTGAEAALVVNNCAAAALLILTVLAADGETIVSRGELVEIGGDFRVPDVMANSGTRMVEVGSTNRTHVKDYRGAMNDQTRLIMRVHPSNYRIIGFTDSPALSELAELAHQSGMFLYEDAGSGVLTDLTEYGLTDEPIVSDSLAAGADVVSFSGDKLLGGSQAGLIVGRAEVINRLRTHSLYRALRADKLCLAALEATLEAHRRSAVDEIPALRMLSLKESEIEKRAKCFVALVAEENIAGLGVSVVPGESAIGGGCGPDTHPGTTLVALKHDKLSADQLEQQLRSSPTPVIARVAGGLVLLDLRTVTQEEETDLLQALTSLDAP